MPKCQLFSVLRNVVFDIHDKASFFPAVHWTAKSPPNHLLVESTAVHWASDVEGADGWRVKTRSQHVVVCQDSDSSGFELFYVIAATPHVSFCGNRFCGNPL